MSYAYAACGPGKTPTYGDISAVRYAHTNCLGRCPSYEVLIWLDLWYVGRTYVDMPGTYKAPVGNTLMRARRILEAHKFFSLNAVEGEVTDVPHLIVAAVRCSVTTTLDWPAFEKRPDITNLFDALDALIKNVKWHKTSDSTESPEGLLAPIP